MSFTPMTDVPNPLFDLNGDPFSGAVLKAYLPGTTTAISIYTDAAGSSPQATLTANAQGAWEVTGSEVVPYIDQDHKWGIFANASDAASNTPFYMGPFDNVTAGVPLTSPNLAILFDNVADMISGTLPDGNTVVLAIGQTAQTLGYIAKGDGGNNTYEIVAASTGTDDGGSFIDLNVLQAKGLFQSGDINADQFGLARSSWTEAPVTNMLAYNSGRAPFLNLKVKSLKRDFGAAEDGTDQTTIINKALANTKILELDGMFGCISFEIPIGSEVIGLSKYDTGFELIGDVDGIDVGRYTELSNFRIIGSASQTSSRYALGMGTGSIDSARSNLNSMVIGGKQSSSAHFNDDVDLQLACPAIKGGNTFLNNFNSVYMQQADYGYLNTINSGMTSNNALVFNGCESQSNRIGVAMSLMNNVVWSGGAIEGNQEQGLIVGTSRAFKMFGCQFESNNGTIGTGDSTIKADILIQPTAIGGTDPSTGMSIEDCRIHKGPNSEYGIYHDGQRNLSLNTIFFKEYDLSPGVAAFFSTNHANNSGSLKNIFGDGADIIINSSEISREDNGISYNFNGTTASLTATVGTEDLFTPNDGEVYDLSARGSNINTARRWSGLVRVDGGTMVVTVFESSNITIQDNAGAVQLQNDQGSAQSFVWSAVRRL